MNESARILVVDDDSTNLQIFSEILRAAGHEVWEASTGQQGLRIARERRPELVVLDVMLPDVSGIEVCRQIKTDPALSDVFVVLFSGQATSVPEKVDGLMAEADDYIARPVSPQEFLARIRVVLRLQQSTAALRAGEQRYRGLIEILPEGAGLMDLQGRLLTVNHQAVALLGYGSAGELLEKSALDLTPPEDHDRIRADIAATLMTGSLRNAKYDLLRKNGDRFTAELSASVSRNTKGQPIGLVVILRDITERASAEAALRAEQERFRQLAENIRDVFWMTDPAKNQMIYINPGYEEIWGRSRESLYASPRNWIEAIHEEDRERVLERALTDQGVRPVR